MTTPLCSIIIPCYNSAETVSDAIQSALGQTGANVEVIAIDDGSQDHTLETLKSFGDQIRWESGPNRGACAARNRGLRIAQGEWVQFLDADDLLDQNKIALQLPAAQKYEDALVFCDGRTIGPPHPHCVRRDSTNDPVIYMLQGGLPTPAPLHRMEWLRAAGGFREDLPCAQDRDLHLRLAATGLKFLRIPESLYTVLRQSASVSSNVERVFDQHSGIAWSVYQDLERTGQLTDTRRRAFAAFLARDARAYLRMGRRDKAASYFEQAREMHPQGGLDLAYGRFSRIARNLFGAAAVESLSQLRRNRK